MWRAVVLSALLLVALPSARALELGDLQLDSAPGAPLSGTLAISDTEAVAVNRLEVGLASERAHAEAGINPAALPTTLALRRSESAPDRIEVMTANPPGLAEAGATLEFLVRLRWPEGQILRRYQVESDGTALQGRASSSARYGPTRRNDTLYSIAEQLRPRAVTNNQMMLSLLAENRASFNANNVNALQRDAFLTVPRGEALGFPDESTATQRVLAQQRAWQTDQRSVVETGPTSISESAPPPEPTESAEPSGDVRPMLELLPADAVAERSQAVSEALAPLKSQLDRLETSNESLSAQNRSLQATLLQLQSDVLRLEGLLEQSTSASRPTASAPTAAVPTEEAADNVTAAMVKAWLVDQARAAIDNPHSTLRMPWAQWTLGVTAFVLLLILFRMRQRRRARQAAAAAMPSHWQPSLNETRVRPLDDAPEDPLSRASELIAYGQLEGAQSILDEALGEEPDSIDLRVKLLDVLAMQDDRIGFESEAHVLQAQINDPEDERWQRVAIQGRRLSPDYPLFQA
ncbi:FimV family protein [Spiribacter vilamensis]|uniref:Pilus assembly protein FimV n=1 Tax=Spiribacter vilamensis TaxID=531306 RepID=A0A4Q8CYD4_9GAMM|nr:FimV/HubP family polar landmark protein [Spiribacter vilamensis]RZU97983.1 pilus assembly protein FimV [Spiribacter vilamensis]TVO61104.1 hypothetical protein FPL09_02830 [Spiribacter vilamensis]